MDLSKSCSSLSLLFFFVFFFFLHIHFLVPASGVFPQFEDCAPYDCGNEQISYPFRHYDRPNYCGYPGYELDCDGAHPILSMDPLEYRVIFMNMSTQILAVARTDLPDNICVETPVDTLLNSSLFSYTSSDLNSTLFYGCDSSPTLQSYRFSCPSSRDGYFDFDVDPADPLPTPCNLSVRVPILQIEALGLPPLSENGDGSAAISRFLKGVFEITWIADTSQCGNCSKSGGRCGYDLEKRQFSCFCRDRAYSRTCPSGMYAYSHLICSSQLAKATR